MPKWFLSILFLAFSFNGSDAIAHHIENNYQEEEQKKLLILISAAYGRKGIETFNRGVFDAWTASGYSISNISTHYLDLNQNPNVKYRLELANFIAEKERHESYDLILLVQQDAVDFYVEYLPFLSKRAKLIAAFSNLDKDWLEKEGRKGLNMTDSLDYESTIDTAMGLYPNTNKLVVVNGATPSDRKPLLGLHDYMSSKHRNLKFDQT